MIKTIIVILGHMNDQQGHLSDISISRLNAGLAAFNKTPNAAILLTGGFGEHFNQTATSHADYAKVYLLQQGLPSSAIIEPHTLSGNTVEDAKKSLVTIKKLQPQSLLLVTSDFHIARAEFIFSKVFAQLPITTVSANCVMDAEKREALCAHEHKRLHELQQEPQWR